MLTGLDCCIVFGKDDKIYVYHQIREKRTNRKHNTHRRQPHEQHKTKTNMNVNCYKSTKDSRKQETNIYEWMTGSTALERSATSAPGVSAVKSDLRALNITLTHYYSTGTY